MSAEIGIFSSQTQLQFVPLNKAPMHVLSIYVSAHKVTSFYKGRAPRKAEKKCLHFL